MEQKLRFGLVLGRLAILKKSRVDYEQLSRAFFSCFHGQKNLDLKYCSVCTKNMKVKKTYFFSKLDNEFKIGK